MPSVSSVSLPAQCAQSCPSVIAALSFFFLVLLEVRDHLLIAGAHDQLGYFYSESQ